MPTYRTPDVYVEEISVFPPSVAEVETAIPAFIGYTETATRTRTNDLILKPTKIYSLKEYEQHFGLANAEPIAVTVTGDATAGFQLSALTVNGSTPDNNFLSPYLLYHAAKMYFDNGGGQAYIVSVGTYQGDAVPLTTKISLAGAADDPAHPETSFGLQDGLNALATEDEPTLIVVPEAANLSAASYGDLVKAVLAQCGKLGDRFGIFDLYKGSFGQDLDPEADGTTIAAAARDAFGTTDLKYGAVYYPFVRTTMNYFVNRLETNVQVTPPVGATVALGTLSSTGANRNTAVYNFVKAQLANYYLVMPPSGAVAGVYAWTDTNRGVWKAPANMSLTDVIEPVVKLDNAHQDTLNIDPTSGKSINAIRSFSGKGTLVWGARTLAGNDNEWRYISVRRFFNMVEESVKKSTYWAVFESNDANTWVKVRGMIENYLTQKWREGALAGATTKEAFFVRCGLGTTMSAIDILEGRMNVEIGMAVVRPAEFIILKFSHKLQTS
jgi:phage tail sheath protein FI